VDIWHKTAGGATISRHEYTIDSVGRRVGESLNGGTSAVAYTFDNGGQLTNEVRTGSNAYTTSYTYDNAGNRTSKTLGATTENYTYDDANKLLTAGGKSYSYDAAGNTTGVSSSSSTVSLTWDGAGRLKAATTSAGTYTYTSNGIGQRVAKSGPGVSQSYVLGSDAIDAPVLSDGAASYVYAGGLVSEVRGGTSKFYHSDALGTTRAITNSGGSTTDSLTTDAFGMTVSGSGSTPTPFGFAGQAGYQSDPETGLMRLGHRYYDNSTGHFISRDPIRDGYNWYAYCGNDPVNALDPQGLFVQFLPIIAVVALVIIMGVVYGGISKLPHEPMPPGAVGMGPPEDPFPSCPPNPIDPIFDRPSGRRPVPKPTLAIGHGSFDANDKPNYVPAKRPIHFYNPHDTPLQNEDGNELGEQIAGGNLPTPVESIAVGEMVRRYKLRQFTPDQIEHVIFPPGSYTPGPSESVYIDLIPGDGPLHWLACRYVE
jgi:RHS repeat-associated protein